MLLYFRSLCIFDTYMSDIIYEAEIALPMWYVGTRTKLPLQLNSKIKSQKSFVACNLTFVSKKLLNFKLICNNIFLTNLKCYISIFLFYDWITNKLM